MNTLDKSDTHEAHVNKVKATNIFTVEHRMELTERWRRNGHTSGVLWLTGLSGSGKSTLAMELERLLHNEGYNAYVLDGDNVRGGLNSDLGFSPEDRTENIRRIGEAAGLFADAGFIANSAFISPYREDRRIARAVRPDHFHEVFVKASVEVCEKRDPKGLYKKARAGKIPEFTGVSAPYEEPEAAELIVDTAELTIEESLSELMDYVRGAFALGEASKQNKVA